MTCACMLEGCRMQCLTQNCTMCESHARARKLLWARTSFPWETRCQFCELHSLHCSSNTTPLCLISGIQTSTPPFSFCDALVNFYMPAHFQTTVRVNISNAWHQSCCKSSWTARAFTNFNVYQVYSNHICNYADYIRLLIHSRLAHTVQEGGKPQTHWDCHRRLFICTKHWLNAFGLPKLTELEYIGISRNMTRRLLMIPCTRMLMDARSVSQASVACSVTTSSTPRSWHTLLLPLHPEASKYANPPESGSMTNIFALSCNPMQYSTYNCHGAICLLFNDGWRFRMMSLRKIRIAHRLMFPASASWGNHRSL